MFYPQDTTIEMGPTAIIPSSYLCGVNREGFFHSEDRVRAELLAPQSLNAWKESMAAFPENSDLPGKAGDDEREESAVRALRSPELREQRLTVPAGTLVFMHHDCVHRACRSEPGAPFRAMIAIRNVVGLRSNPLSGRAGNQ